MGMQRTEVVELADARKREGERILGIERPGAKSPVSWRRRLGNVVAVDPGDGRSRRDLSSDGSNVKLSIFTVARRDGGGLRPPQGRQGADEPCSCRADEFQQGATGDCPAVRIRRVADRGMRQVVRFSRQAPF